MSAATVEARDPAIDTIQEFLELLYGHDADGYLYVWTLPDKLSHWFAANEIESMAETAARLSATHDTYFSVGLHPKKLGQHERGAGDVLKGIAGGWCDIDYGTEGHKSTGNPPDLAGALAIIAAFPCKPTVVVHSGHGVHAWWLFAEPWIFDTNAERDDAQHFVMRFQKTIAQKATELGWRIDSTFNLTQVLRPPGTWNLKTAPVEVQVLGSNPDCRYSRDDLELLLIDLEAWEKARPVELPKDLPKVDVNTLNLPPGVKDLITDGGDPKHYRSRSDAAWRAARECVEHGLDDATIAGIFFDPDNVIGEKAREQGQRWFAAELGRARKKARPITILEPDWPTPAYRASPNGTVTGPVPRSDDTGDVASESPAETVLKRGLIRTLAEHVLQRVAIARDVGGLLYVFEHGVYTPRGKQVVQRGVQALLNAWNMSPLWSSKLANEVHEYIRVTAPELWERPPLDTINVRNGLLDVRSGTLKPHDPAHLSSVQLPVDFDPEATCPAWEKFISEVFPDDAQALAWELVAWLMTADTSIQKAVLLLGAGANGKSTFLRALLAFLGKRMTASLALQKLETDRFAVARLVGKLANICPDLPSGHLDSTSVFKAITGGDILTAERKYADSFEFEPFARLVFSANHAPRSADASEAFFRRWQVIPFTRRFKAADDPERESGDGVALERRDLDATLADPKELSGVLNQALAVLAALRKRGFSTPASVRAAGEEFRATTDPLSIWLDQHTIDNPNAFVVRDDLRKAYRADCGEHGRPTLSDTAFGIAFKRARPDVTDAYRTVGAVRKYCYAGLGLLATPVQGVQGVQGFSNCFVSDDESEAGTPEDAGVYKNNNRENPAHPAHPAHPDMGTPPSGSSRCPCGGTKPDPLAPRCPACLTLIEQIRSDLGRAEWVQLRVGPLTIGPGAGPWHPFLAAVPPSINLAELARLAAEAADLAEGAPL